MMTTLFSAWHRFLFNQPVVFHLASKSYFFFGNDMLGPKIVLQCYNNILFFKTESAFTYYPRDLFNQYILGLKIKIKIYFLTVYRYTSKSGLILVAYSPTKLNLQSVYYSVCNKWRMLSGISVNLWNRYTVLLGLK